MEELAGRDRSFAARDGLLEASGEQLGEPIGRGMTAEVFALGDDRVLKLYNAGLPRDWAVYEERVARAAGDSGAGAPACHGLLEREGRVGVVYERIDGPSMLDAVSRRPLAAVRMGRELARLHLRMHARRAAALPGLKDRAAAQIGRAEGLAAAEKEALLAALAAMPEGDRVLHGDFHAGNVILGPAGPLAIDWMNGCAGDPGFDCARSVLMIRSPFLPPEMPALVRALAKLLKRLMLRAYLREYLRGAPAAGVPVTLASIDAWMPVVAAARIPENIPGERDWLLGLARRGRAKRGRAGSGPTPPDRA